jgi:cellulose 1,4-beta-cellobiosidase
MNEYRMGNKDFYGPGSQFAVDTTKPFTFVTQFHAPNGELEEIVQYYLQHGKRIDHENTETKKWCKDIRKVFKDRDSFNEKGGFKSIGAALDRGMVLTLSLWDDIGFQMNWLDSWNPKEDKSQPGVVRGPCQPTDGQAETLREKHPDSKATVTNVKWGGIGTTQKDTPSGSFSCDECVSHGFKEDQCGCGYCSSFGGCGFTCGKDPSQAPPGPQCEKTIKCSECEAHGYESDQCGCGYCGSYGSCGWTCGHDSKQAPRGPKCSVGSVEV